MNDLRTAAQQALEALETLVPTKGPSIYNSARDDLRAALAQQADPTDPGHDVDVLREHVRHLERRVRELHAQQAEPVQEPVAWIQPDHLQKARVAPFLCRVEPTQRFPDFVAFYTAPPQRLPLTEDEIYHATGHCGVSEHTAIKIARIVEEASWEKNHGQA